MLNSISPRYWGCFPDNGMRFLGLGIRGLEKEQEGLVKSEIEMLKERVACLEAEVSELKKKQWSFGPLTEPIEVVGSYYTTVGAGIE